MKKIAIALAALMMAAACVLPASAAAETKTVSVDPTNSVADANLINAGAGFSEDGEPGGYYYADAESCVAFKFTIEAGATDVKVNVPVAGTFVIYGSAAFDPATATTLSTRDSWTKLAEYTDYLPADVTEFGMNEEHGWSAAYDPCRTDITVPAELIAKCTDNTLYIIVCDYSTDDGNGPCIYAADTATSFAVKYGNRRYNLQNNLTDADADFRAEGTAVAGAPYEGFDGLCKLTYTVGSDVTPGTDAPSDTDAPAPPTGDAAFAIVTIAVIAGAALVITKKKIH